MKLEWNQWSLISLILGSVLFLLFVIFGNQFMLAPQKKSLEEKAAVIEQEERILEAIEEKNEERGRDRILSSRVIQQQLPVVPLIDQLLLGLDRAEHTSTSLINRVDISESESMVSYSEKAADVGEKEQLESDSEAGSPDKLIEGLKTMQLAVEVTSKNYEEMMKFIESVQSLMRVTQIESMQFEDPDSEQELHYSFILHTYYQPRLSELANEAPQYNYGESSVKINPFTIKEGEKRTADDLNGGKEETSEAAEEGLDPEMEESVKIEDFE
ncbi:hypothetical protein [Halobacillus litoralis]|uniref:hypothetical protein n=1 Tax=Halobacillus litoralis TaxID=45668 RepID=UPI001CFD9B9C|nr:hypothetical protein [Halobacillus litoralis]